VRPAGRLADRELVAPLGVADWSGAHAQERLGRSLRRWLQFDRPVLSSKVAIDLLRIVDCGLVLGVGWLALLAVDAASDAGAGSLYSLVALLGAVLLVNILQVMGAYSADRVRRPLAHLQDVAGAVLLTTGILIAAAFFTGTAGSFGRDWAIAWILGASLLLVATRVGLHGVLQQLKPTSRSGWLRRNVAIVGPAPEAARLIAYLEQAGDPHIRLVGVYDDRPATGTGAQLVELPGSGSGSIADLCALSRRLTIDKIYVAIPWSRENELAAVLRQLECLPVDVRLQLPPIGDRLLNRQVSYLHGVPFVNVVDRPLGEWAYLLKWTEDRVIALVALLLVSPILALIALAIKLDSPGPVLFRQQRYGFNNRLIEVLKFRTMRQELCDPNAKSLTRRNDPRITRLGHFLRRTSLDELPQLVNVLRGEMSIVGPRPHPIEAKAANRYYHDVVAGYAARHKIKPGITGWAQVNGWRGPTDTEEQLCKRVEHDLHYLDNWSLGLDLKIILMTVYRGLVSKNAF